MAIAKKKADIGLGTHKGYPILGQKVRFNMGDSFNRTMEIAPIADFVTGGRRNASLALVQTAENFENVPSEDDPETILGVTQVIVFRVEAAGFDEREETDEMLTGLAQRVAQHIEDEKNARTGKMSLPYPEGDRPEATVSDIRPGVKDDEGARE